MFVTNKRFCWPYKVASLIVAGYIMQKWNVSYFNVHDKVSTKSWTARGSLEIFVPQDDGRMERKLTCKFFLLWPSEVILPRNKKAPSSLFVLFWLGEDFRGFTVRSAGAVAAVLEDALLEEWRELADGVFGEMETVCVSSERRARGQQHHPEQVPQITL